MTRNLLESAVLSVAPFVQAAVTSGLCHYHQFRRVGTPAGSFISPPLEETMTEESMTDESQTLLARDRRWVVGEGGQKM